MPNISVIHPSRSRPEQCAKTVRRWLAQADNPYQIEWLVSLDMNDGTLAKYNEQLPMSVTILRNGNRSAIDAINHAAQHATADIMMVVSDDTDCFYKWDEALLHEIGNRHDFTMKTQDGIQPFIITMPLLDRVYYSRFGWIYNPMYLHLFADTEYTAVAHLLGRAITSNLLFPHLHYTTGKTKKDAINVKNDATWKQGEALYKQRCAINFGLRDEDIVQQLPDMLNLK